MSDAVAGTRIQTLMLEINAIADRHRRRGNLQSQIEQTLELIRDTLKTRDNFTFWADDAVAPFLQSLSSKTLPGVLVDQFNTHSFDAPPKSGRTQWRVRILSIE